MADKHTVDARGLSCPQPVLMTKKALQANPSANAFEIIVDNGTAKENVTRFATNSGFHRNGHRTGRGLLSGAEKIAAVGAAAPFTQRKGW